MAGCVGVVGARLLRVNGPTPGPVPGGDIIDDPGEVGIFPSSPFPLPLIFKKNEHVECTTIPTKHGDALYKGTTCDVFALLYSPLFSSCIP